MAIRSTAPIRSVGRFGRTGVAASAVLLLLLLLIAADTEDASRGIGRGGRVLELPPCHEER